MNKSPPLSEVFPSCCWWMGFVRKSPPRLIQLSTNFLLRLLLLLPVQEDPPPAHTGRRTTIECLLRGCCRLFPIPPYLSLMSFRLTVHDMRSLFPHCVSLRASTVGLFLIPHYLSFPPPRAPSHAGRRCILGDVGGPGTCTHTHTWHRTRSHAS